MSGPLKGPGLPSVGGPGAGGRPGVPAKAAMAYPEFEEWNDDSALPSLLLLGASGTGKTDALAKLMMAGFKLGITVVEPKILSAAKFKPLQINLCKPVKDGGKPRLPTPVERYDRLMRFTDGLRAGMYRTTPSGEYIDLLGMDGLMEAAELIAKAKARRFSDKQSSADRWLATGNEIIDLMRTLRDAAGTASTQLGLPPIGIVATCGEGSPKKLDMKAGTSYIERDVPLLPGNMALTQLPFVFEVIWRLSGGANDDGQHEWRVHTQVGDTWFAKSPGGLFDIVVAGPGGVTEDGTARTPDIGAMYRELLTNSRSPYYRKELVGGA